MEHFPRMFWSEFFFFFFPYVFTYDERNRQSAPWLSISGTAGYQWQSQKHGFIRKQAEVCVFDQHSQRWAGTLELQVSSRGVGGEMGTICIFIYPCILDESKVVELHQSHFKAWREFCHYVILMNRDQFLGEENFKASCPYWGKEDEALCSFRPGNSSFSYALLTSHRRSRVMASVRILWQIVLL